jgi:hypothetical protein
MELGWKPCLDPIFFHAASFTIHRSISPLGLMGCYLSSSPNSDGGC